MKAIILAAGLGTRLIPLSSDCPKPLVKVNGKPMIETQIECLLEKGIKDIKVAVGYLKEKFYYLVEKYNVELIYNDKYDIYNNIYTMYLLREHLPDSYVIEGDVYICNNFIDPDIKESTYFTLYKENFNNEFIFKFDENNKVYDMYVGNNKGYILCGVSYWSLTDGNIIVKKLEETIENGDFESLFWDDVVMQNKDALNMYIQKIDFKDCFEIDNEKDLRFSEKCIVQNNEFTMKKVLQYSK